MPLEFDSKIIPKSSFYPFTDNTVLIMQRLRYRNDDLSMRWKRF